MKNNIVLCCMLYYLLINKLLVTKICLFLLYFNLTIFSVFVTYRIPLLRIIRISPGHSATDFSDRYCLNILLNPFKFCMFVEELKTIVRPRPATVRLL